MVALFFPIPTDVAKVAEVGMENAIVLNLRGVF